MNPSQNFEEAITELENIVNTLEKGDLALEDTLKKFEQGMKLSQFCQQALTEAQDRMTQLMNDGKDDDKHKHN
jgi:exodeoxyribonuclease VII small subunit